MLLALRMADGASKELQEKKKKINIIGLPIYSFDKDFYKPKKYSVRPQETWNLNICDT